MKAQELRIGNWHIWDSSECQVEADTLSSMNYGSIESCPIPLTEEWLLKFNVCCEWRSGIIELFLLSGDYIISAELCEYVHQLQNICFSLTGEELTIKE